MGNEQSTDTEPTQVNSDSVCSTPAKENNSFQNGTVHEKHENGPVNGLSTTITANGLEINAKNDISVVQNSEPPSSKPGTETADGAAVKSDVQTAVTDTVSEVIEKVSEIIESSSKSTEMVFEEQVKKGKEEKSRLFGKLFQKKTDRPADHEKVKEETKDTSGEDQMDVSEFPAAPQQDTVDPKQESESVPEPSSSKTAEPKPEEEPEPEPENGDVHPAENQEEKNPEENSVMNFFKTLVTTKTAKKETAGPDATKDQVAQISEPPSAPKGMPAPPPPPPEPPKMDTKGEPTTKLIESTPKDEAKAAAKQPEASKGKSAKDTFSKFFHPKVLIGVKKPKGASTSGANIKPPKGTNKDSPQPDIEVEVQPGIEVKETSLEMPEPVLEMQMIKKQVELQEAAVEVGQHALEEQKVDSSKADTLEAAAKPESPPPVQEKKKAASKSSFTSLFKSKVLLDHMSTYVQAASTSGARLLRKSTGLSAEPKKTTLAPPAAEAEAAPAIKAKDEPKAAAKHSEAAVDNKPASAACPAGDDAASVPRKLEKRNSIQLFFKNLGQKRHSTDAGVQTEPMSAASASEKTK
ncbi:breast carcinoma-amplified sequence 1 isoform X2 [Nothobranchius furzeri]|uniref:Transcript variant X2 n=1 Tax=Nothobranchius furzeri TaxID=105023 RepID=A0A9D2XWI1_NOTFU|nr:breast carcinoma-amplified sequence 1 isoform X2 [Nothobranchius furzeri]KAF7209218.1 transcript variant X2 [Nothobranchius furzeri]